MAAGCGGEEEEGEYRRVEGEACQMHFTCNPWLIDYRIDFSVVLYIILNQGTIGLKDFAF